MKIGSTLLSLLILNAIIVSFALADVKNDNSGINRTDLAASELTSDQQSNGKNDLQITREIRQDIIANKNLSLYAHNVKIIAKDGDVTLRGPVRSRAEEAKVVKVAQNVAGQSHVVDKLQISEYKKSPILKRRIL